MRIGNMSKVERIMFDSVIALAKCDLTHRLSLWEHRQIAVSYVALDVLCLVEAVCLECGHPEWIDPIMKRVFSRHRSWLKTRDYLDIKQPNVGTSDQQEGGSNHD